MRRTNTVLLQTIRTQFLATSSSNKNMMEPIIIDLQNQRIGMWNLGEKVGHALQRVPSPKSEERFILNLSDNQITDEDIPALASMIESYNFKPHLQILNLSNNRLTLEGAKELIPLLRSEQLKWLDISINNLGVSDLRDLWNEIETQAHRATIVEELNLPLEEIRDQWASKVILLPRDYTIERFPLSPPFVHAHQQYFKLAK